MKNFGLVWAVTFLGCTADLRFKCDPTSGTDCVDGGSFSRDGGTEVAIDGGALDGGGRTLDGGELDGGVGDAGSGGALDGGGGDAGGSALDGGGGDAGGGALDGGGGAPDGGGGSVSDAGNAVDGGAAHPVALIALCNEPLPDAGWEVRLRRVDPTSGETVVIAVPAEQFHLTSIPGHADPMAPTISYVGQSEGDSRVRLFTIDARTGATLFAPFTQPDGRRYFFSVGAFPMGDGGVTGVTWEAFADGGGIEMVRTIDPRTGQTSLLATLPGFDSTNGVAAFDSERARLYAIASTAGQGNKMFTIDMRSGAILASPLLVARPTGWSSMSVTLDGGLIGLTYRNGIEELHRINPSSGDYTVINTIPGIDTLTGAFAYEQMNNRACFTTFALADTRLRLVCIDTRTGNITSNAVFTPGDIAVNDLQFAAQ